MKKHTSLNIEAVENGFLVHTSNDPMCRGDRYVFMQAEAFGEFVTEYYNDTSEED